MLRNMLRSATQLSSESRRYARAATAKERFCNLHRPPECIAIKSRYCEYPGCTRQPSFNRPNESRAIFCSQHKEPGSIDVQSRRCLHTGCIKYPLFGYHIESQGLFCALHKWPDHVRVGGNLCQADDCARRALYNCPAETVGMFCYEHQEPHHVDVVSKRCQESGCTAIAHYGPIFSSATHCAHHKRVDEYQNRYPVCIIRGCPARPECVDDAAGESDYPTHCMAHAQELEDARLVVTIQF